MNHLAILTNARQEAITVTATSTNPDIFAGSRATMELNTIAAAYGSSVASPEKPHVQAGDRKGFVESILEVLSEPLDFDMIHSKPINHPIF